MTIHILTLGDSITQGDSQHASYRRSLWKKLQDGGYDIDFVGSLTGNHEGDNPFNDFDLDHEGHWGWTADEILTGDASPASGSGSGNLADWLAGYTPDIVLMHLGTNDMFRDDSVSQALADLENVIAQLRQDNPDVTIFLAQVIPTTRDDNDDITAFNQAIPQFAADNSTVTSQIIVVDQSTNFDPVNDTYDGVHPNLSGEEKMAQRWFEALETVLEPTLSASQGGDLGDRTSEIWEFEEWDLINPTFSGNPFDVEGDVTFTHTASGETRTTGIYYDGGDEWSFRFTGDLLGEWTFQTNSSDSDLNNFSGSINVNPNDNPEVQGFLTSVGNKFAIQTTDANTLEGYLFNVYMNQQEHFEQGQFPQNWTSSDTTNYLNDARDNGFEVLYFQVNNNWFDLGSERRTDHQSRDPDIETFEILEQIIFDVHQQGGRVHLWAWGDEDRQWTPIDGINSEADQRLQSYIADRLGPLPGWSMGYAFDTQEFTDDDEMEFWANNLQSQMGWEHLLFSRGYAASPGLDIVNPSGNNDWVATALSGNSYSSKGDAQRGLQTSPVGPSTIEEVIEDINSDLTKPHLYEERFTYNRSRVGSTPGVTFDMDQTRRTLWWQAMAGGVGGWYGFFKDRPEQTPPYPNPEQLRTHYTFWHENDRFTLDLEQANDLADSENTYLLRRSDDSRYIIYGEDVATVQIDLPNLLSATNVIAVDTKADYQEIDLGVVDPGNDRQLVLPYQSDWAIIVEGVATPDTTAPTALLTAPDLTVDGGSTYRFTVTYSDDRTIFIPSLDAQDVVVRDDNDQTIPVVFIGVDNSSYGGTINAIYEIQAPGDVWDVSDNGVYTVTQLANQVTDTANNAVAAGLLGSFTVNIVPDTTNPVVAGFSAPTLAMTGTNVYEFTVIYTDNQAIALASLDNADITVSGPNGFSQVAELVSVNASNDGTPLTATYRITAPGGIWDSDNNGTYQISLNPDEVTDVSGNSAAAAEIGSFAIAIPDAPPDPLRLEAETMTLGGNYRIESNPSIASGGSYIGLNGPNGTATTDFSGITGLYEVVVGYYDESDGTANLAVSIEGNLIDSWEFDNSPGGTRATSGNFTLRTIATSLAINNGDTVLIEGMKESGENARVDYIEFIYVGNLSTNGDPVAVADSYTTAEDAALNVVVEQGVLANDSDPDLDTLIVSGFDNTTAQGGSVTMNSDGSFNYTPAANFNGTDSFQYTVSDGQGGTANGTVSITVTPVNDAPVATDDALNTSENQALTIASATLIANDQDIDEDTLTVTEVGNATNGSVSLDENSGEVLFTPASGYVGPASFEYTISDGQGGTATATVNITVTEVNDFIPEAINDSYTVDEDQPLIVAAAAGVLSNDRDGDSDPLNVIDADTTTSQGGSVTVNSDGSFEYLPAADFNGTDSFEYTISDGKGGTASATVEITVNALNDAPVATDDSVDTDVNTPLLLSAANLLSNDLDVDLDALTIANVSNALNGTVDFDSDAQTITFTPDADFTGTAQFDYTVQDAQGEQDTATVIVEVASAVDDSRLLWWKLDDGSGQIASDATGNNRNGTLQNGAGWTPDGQIDGALDLDNTDGFVTDADAETYLNGLDAITVSIWVKADAVDSDRGFFSTVPNNGDDSDLGIRYDDRGFRGGGDDVIKFGLRTTNGSTNYESASGVQTTDWQHVVITWQSGEAPKLFLDGQLDTPTAAATPLGGTITDVTDLFVGKGQRSATSWDGQIDDVQIYGRALTLSEIVAIYNDGNTASPVNTPPVALADSYTATEDAPLTVIAAQGVLANDTDADVDTLTVVNFDVTSAAGGTVNVSTDGSFSYTPLANFNGVDTFNYTISDGQGGTATSTVSITVAPVNDTPVATDDALNTSENQALTLVPAILIANDQDIDGGGLTVTEVGNATNGSVVFDTNSGEIIFTPASDYIGPASFEYTITDGQGDEDTAIVNITVTEPGPNLPDYLDALLALNPIAYWPVNETNGTVADDTVGNIDGIYRNGVVLGGTGAITNSSDTAITLDGNNDYLEIPHDNDFELAAGSVAVWINPTNTNGPQTLFSKDSSGFDDGGHFSLSLQGDRLELRSQSDSESRILRSDSGLITANTWQQIVVTWGANGTRIYHNGVEVAEDTQSAFGWSGNREPIVLGASQARSGNLVANRLENYFEGDLDEIALFDSVLTVSEIAELYASGTGVAMSTVNSNAMGLTLNDVLLGDEQANVLEGGIGDTVLTGNGGADQFVYRSLADGFDQITDFDAEDQLVVFDDGFTGDLSSGFSFVSGASPSPSDNRPTFLYNSREGILSYDSDGNGEQSAMAFLQLNGAPNLEQAQIVIA